MIYFVYDELLKDPNRFLFGNTFTEAEPVPNLMAYRNSTRLLNTPIWNTLEFELLFKKLDPNENHFRYITMDQVTDDGEYYYPIFFNHQEIFKTFYSLWFLSKTLVEKINDGKIRLLLVMVTEGTRYQSQSQIIGNMSILCNLIHHQQIIRPKSVIVLTSDKVFSDFCSNLKFHDTLDFKYMPWFEYSYYVDIIVNKSTYVSDQELETYLTSEKNKEFLCWNHINGIRLNRILLVKELKMQNLLHRGYVSQICKNIGYVNSEINNVLQKRNDRDDILNRYGNLYITEQIILDDTGDFPNRNFDKKHWLDSYYSVVTETEWDTENTTGFLTEKIFKPIANGHPFIMVTNKNALKMVKELGYETYPELFDESYDDMEFGLNKIVNIVNSINNFSVEKYKQNSNIIREKIIYNRNHFMKKDHISYIKNILK